MRNLLSRAEGFFGRRLFLISLVIFISGFFGYQVGLRSREDLSVNRTANCEPRSPEACRDTVLGAETETTGKNEPEEKKAERRRVYRERSPDGEHDVVLYEMPFVGDGDLDYRNYMNNQHFYSVEDVSFTSGRETYVFVGDYKAGYPHWLDNEHIFFTSGCGTGCQGMYLVSTRTKESRQAVVFTNPLGAESFETQFHDWFGQDFKFSGWSKNIRAAFLEGKAYLVFQMWNNNQPLGEKRFLFTGKLLEAF